LKKKREQTSKPTTGGGWVQAKNKAGLKGVVGQYGKKDGQLRQKM